MSEERLFTLESEAGFRVLFQNATVGILVVSDTGQIQLSNPFADRLFGYKPAELIALPVEVLMPDALRAQHAQHRSEYFLKPKTRPMGLGMELFARKKNGDVFPVEISLGHYELDGEKLAVAFVTDITAQVRAKTLMAEREAWFRNMADNSPVMIWVCGADKGCTYFNNTWLGFTGRSADRESGRGWTDGIHPDDLASYQSSFDEAFERRQSFLVEYRLMRHDGRYRWIRTDGKPSYYDETFTGFIASSSDIHDHRTKNEELEDLVNRRTAQLSEALGLEREMNELKSRFVSMASHEFRTPLSIVLSSTSLLEQYGVGEKDERVQRHLARIKTSIGNLTGILNDFLSLDKLEQGLVGVETVVFDFTSFMDEVVADVDLFRKEGQRIIREHRGNASVALDLKKLRYVINNLLSNSAKYSPANSEIIIASENREESFVVSVADHGIGIPEEQQKFLFNKFFRARNTGSVPGTGLGLTIVKRYVDLMGGEISFQSKVGEGTTFTLKIPKG